MTFSDEAKSKTKLREALINVYCKPIKLKIFVQDSFNKNLDEISTASNLEELAFELIQHYESDGLLYELYKKFYQHKNNRDNPCVAELKKYFCLDDSFISATSSPEQTELEKLFLSNNSWYDYLLEAKRAFLQSFKTIKGRDFQEYRPGCSKLSSFEEIIEFLKEYYSPELLVTFAESLITEIQKTNQKENLDAPHLEQLRQWRDRFSEKYDVKPKEVIHPSQKAYLLVSILEKAGYVNVWAELRIDTEDKSQPIEIYEDQRGFKCKFDECSEELTKLLQKVEDSFGQEVTLEFFLRLKFLNKDLGIWEFKDEMGNSIALKKHRGFIIRSLDRVYNDKLKYQKVLQNRLKENWSIFKKCLEEETVLRHLHELTQLGYGSGELRNLLQGKPGSKIMIPLSDDNEEQKQVLYEIIIAAIPIALWTCHVDCKPDEVSVAFEQILKKDCLISFADLATHIKKLRIQQKSQPLLNLRILCDCPERLPTLNGRALTTPS